MVLLFLYQVLFVCLTPLWVILLAYRLMQKKEDFHRLRERFGFAGLPRPKGELILMHGASVGECLSMLPLIQKLLDENSHLHIMVTSGTCTSAELMKKRLPKRAFHHYLPIDAPTCMTRLLRYYQPKAAFWFESEFWPTTLAAFRKNGVPLILLNGRISDRSFRRWQKLPWIIRPMLSCFQLTLGQSPEDARRLKILGSPATDCVGNIKCAAPASPFSKTELQTLLTQIGNRPCWCGASTHDPEESMLADVCLQMKKEFKDLLLVSVPRHPNRADDIQKMFETKGLRVARRSQGDLISNQVDVYLADTIGEMGLLYQLTPIVFVGGSLIKFGGQNMLEPMYWSKAVLVGPHAFNFRVFMANGRQQKALVEVQSVTALAQQVRFFLSHPKEQQQLGKRAHKMAISEMAVLDRLYRVLRQQGVA